MKAAVRTILAFLLLVAVGAVEATENTSAQAKNEKERPRLLVLTDIGGDPDDQQSLVRLMTYANEFEIEGIVATASGTPGELKREIVQPHLVREIVEGYGKVRDNLVQHDPAFPPVQRLLDCIKSGNPHRGLKSIGEGHDTEGSQWILRVADRPDPRPLNIAIWGGQTDLAQALWRARQDRGQEGLKSLLARLRVYDIGDQDKIQGWIFANFPDLFFILPKPPAGADLRLAVYRGMYLGGDESLTSRAWIDAHVRTNHGPLGALYPPNTWTAPNPHGALKEGDTPSWFYFLPNGLSDPAHPEWGGWGGRFEHASRGLYRDAKDALVGPPHVRTTVWRWRPAFQNDFQARMEWCVRPPSKANHRPIAVLHGDRSMQVLRIAASAGTTVRLSAEGSTDTDGNRLTYRWWIYREAGTYRVEATISGSEQSQAEIAVPGDAAGKTIHVILEVRDDGQPPLTAYRRAVLDTAGVKVP
jgi:hypothetical protein